MTAGGIFYMCYVKSVQIRPVRDTWNAPPTSSGAPGPGEVNNSLHTASADAAAAIPPLFTGECFHVSTSVVFTVVILFILFTPGNRSPSKWSKGENEWGFTAHTWQGCIYLIEIKSRFNFWFNFSPFISFGLVILKIKKLKDFKIKCQGWQTRLTLSCISGKWNEQTHTGSILYIYIYKYWGFIFLRTSGRFKSAIVSECSNEKNVNCD